MVSLADDSCADASRYRHSVISDWTGERRAIIRDATGVGIAVAAYGVVFGAQGVATGLSLAQTMTLSLLMFTGASQFALVGVLGAGGTGIMAALTALMLGARNTLYGLRLAPLLGVTGAKRLLAAQWTIDESTAMVLAREDHADERAARTAFWATGMSVYVFWNLATLLGALGAKVLGDPRTLGLDAVIPAAFLALLWSRLKGRELWAIAVLSATVAIVLTPVLRPGLPVLAAALVAIIAGMRAGNALAPLASVPNNPEDGAVPGGGPA
jgi:predicted branched-subunit amino acid permease